MAGKTQNIVPMWKLLNKYVDLGEPTSFLDHEYLGCTQRQCETSKNIVDNYRNHVWIQNFRWSDGKLPCSENLRISSWSYDMEGVMPRNVWDDIVSWQTRRLNNSTMYQHQALIWWPSLQRRKIEIRKNWLKMLILGTYWKTRYSVVSEQTCTIDHKMDQSVWQTIKSIDFIHSSHMWIQTYVVMWIILQNNADWDCFKTLTSLEILKIRNPLLEEHCAFWEVIHLFQ